MSRRPARLALVVLAVLVATGPSTLVLADDSGRAATTASDPGIAAAVGPLDETVENATDDATNGTTDQNLSDDSTDENLTDDTSDGNLTDDSTDGNLTDQNHTDDDPTEETAPTENVTTVVDDTANTTDATEEVTSATTELADPDAAVSGAGNATGNVTDDVAGVAGTSDATATRVSLRTADSTRLLGDIEDTNSPAETESDSSSAGESDADADTAADDRTTTTAASAASADSGEGDADSPTDDSDLDGSGLPGGVEVAVGFGALTASALLPHLADGLALAGNAGALSAASLPARSGLFGRLRGRLDDLWRTATPFRYSRYDDSDPLDHEVRAALYETVEDAPGAYLSAVCEAADVPVSTARHHLDVLEDEGLVATAKVRGKRRYFPAHSDGVELTAALADEGTAAVLRALARLGPSHGGRLADELCRDPSTVSHHLSRLEDAGLVEREREGRSVVNRLAPEVRRALREAEGEDENGESESDGETPAVAD